MMPDQRTEDWQNKSPFKNQWITFEEVNRLTEIRSVISLSRIVFEYLLMAVTLLIAIRLDSWFFYPFAVIIIGSRQHSLLVLFHDASHYLICRSQFWNDVVGELMGWTLMASLRGYRRHHSGHHVQSYLNTMKDPDFSRKQNENWVFPMKKSRFYKMVISDLLGINAYDYIRDAKASKNILTDGRTNQIINALRVVFYVLCFSVIAYFSLWKIYLLFWVIPFITYLKFVFRLRSIVDHFLLPNSHLYDRTRTILPNALERFLIAPCSISIHNEHHIFAHVPYYNLKKMHGLLMRNEDYARNIVIEDSYFSFVTKKLTV